MVCRGGGGGGCDVVDLYSKYCDIVSGRAHGSAKDFLRMVSKSMDNKGRIRDTTPDEIVKLMSYIDLDDPRQFNCFYDFVFFICRENGQKNISVQRAVAAWRIVLNGRFRLLEHWCNFVERNQRHNVSEDSWQQVLAFSRSVNEDLEGYDPKGAWPVLIDEFVEHLYSLYPSNDNRLKDSMCSGEKELNCNISATFSGLNILCGSKRKNLPDVDTHEEDMDISGNSPTPAHPIPLKRLKDRCGYEFGVRDSNAGTLLLDGSGNYQQDANKHYTRGCVHNSSVVEDSLSRGFELSLSRCFQNNQNSGAV